MLINEIIFLIYCFLVATLPFLALQVGTEALIALITLECLAVNLMVAKEITLFGLSATATDALAVGITFGLNIMREFYGQHQAQQALRISFAGSILFVIISVLHIAYIPAPTDISNIHYLALLTPLPRIMGASLLVYYTVERLDLWLYGLAKQYSFFSFGKRLLAVTAITQLLDTVLFSFLGLYGILDNIGQIILTTYTIKLITIIIATPIISIVRQRFYDKI